MYNKDLIIDSYLNLWTILKSKEEIYESNQDLESFVYMVSKYMKGCRCNAETEIKLIELKYKVISSDENIHELLKSELEIDSIIFR